MFVFARNYNFPYPYNFAFIPFQRWIDFIQFRPAFEHFHQLDFFTNLPRFGHFFPYPAPVSILA